MKLTESASLIPENKSGKAVDLEQSVVEENEEEAVNTFNRVCTRLLNPPIWHQLTGSLSADFELKAANAENSNRLARVDDYLKITIPGPGNVAGQGYDWVKIEVIEENTVPGTEASFGIMLRSSPNPEHKEEGTAHFFKASATSTFIVKKTGNTISISYHGRNEMPNVTDVSLMDKIRNVIVASGAAVGLSELHWTALLKGMLQKEIGG